MIFDTDILNMLGKICRASGAFSKSITIGAAIHIVE
jgi:hypothetical protein